MMTKPTFSIIERGNMLHKDVVRLEQKKRLNQYSGSSRLQEEAQLRELLFASAQWHNAQVIAVVLSTAMELNTQPIITRAWAENKQIVVPKIINKQMIFVEFKSDSELRTGQLNIKEPVSNLTVDSDAIDLAIVPGLAFTRHGGRLGYGAGYYDRFLVNFKGETVSLALNIQLLESLPMEPHDQKVAKILNQNNT